jgi:hypothetical protein
MLIVGDALFYLNHEPLTCLKLFWLFLKMTVFLKNSYSLYNCTFFPLLPTVEYVWTVDGQPFSLIFSCARSRPEKALFVARARQSQKTREKWAKKTYVTAYVALTGAILLGPKQGVGKTLYAERNLENKIFSNLKIVSKITESS